MPDAVARRRLSQALWRIRQPLRDTDDASPMIVDTHAIQFNTDIPYWLDVQAFFDALKSWREQDSVERLREAIDLYQGDFMAGFYDDWLIPQRERLRDRYLDALENLAARCKEQGNFEEALRFTRQLALAEPLRETAHCEIMRLCRLLERPQEALHQFEIMRETLADELGVEPSSNTLHLYRQLLADRRHPSSAPYFVVPTPFMDRPAAIPLVGRKFERDNLIAGVSAAMQGQGGLALLAGEAGVGKSRLLQELAREADWQGMRVLWGWGEDGDRRGAYHILVQALQEDLSGSTSGGSTDEHIVYEIGTAGEYRIQVIANNGAWSENTYTLSNEIQAPEPTDTLTPTPTHPISQVVVGTLDPDEAISAQVSAYDYSDNVGAGVNVAMRSSQLQLIAQMPAEHDTEDRAGQVTAAFNQPVRVRSFHLLDANGHEVPGLVQGLTYDLGAIIPVAEPVWGVRFIPDSGWLPAGDYTAEVEVSNDLATSLQMQAVGLVSHVAAAGATASFRWDFTIEGTPARIFMPLVTQ